MLRLEALDDNLDVCSHTIAIKLDWVYGEWFFDDCTSETTGEWMSMQNEWGRFQDRFTRVHSIEIYVP